MISASGSACTAQGRLPPETTTFLTLPAGESSAAAKMRSATSPRSGLRRGGTAPSTAPPQTIATSRRHHIRDSQLGWLPCQ